MKQTINCRIEAVRAEMRKCNIDAMVFPQTDPHQSEYLADHWEVRRYLSGFSGSAGTLVVTTDDAALWVDSRYFIQGAQQLQGTDIKLMKMLMPGVPTIEQYLASNLKPGSTVGIDGLLLSVADAQRMDKELSDAHILLDTNCDIVDSVWADRPTLPKDAVFFHDVKYAGESASDKLYALRAFSAEHHADASFISALDEIAWILNIRCSDVNCNPVATSYLYVDKDEAVLFIDADKINSEVASYLKDLKVKVMPYDSVKRFLSELPDTTKVAIETAQTSIAIYNILGERAVSTDSPVAIPKSIKNPVQITGFRNAMVRDGVALVKAFKDVEDALAKGKTVTEMDMVRILKEKRSESPLYFDESFDAIVAYGPHGAIVHYEPTDETNVELLPEGLLLVDTGAQYLDGTTDITRTVALGQATIEEKHDFTLVLKGHIALDRMIFPIGTHGVQLDAEARKFLWSEGLGYMHGTGHGVGHFLNVHEGPQSIRMNYTPVPMMEGMVTSNEPGLYREGVHGIRCENLVLTTKAMSTDFGDFLRFETLTLFPFDLSLIDIDMLTAEEKKWIDAYHEKVYNALEKYLNEEERRWLHNKTMPLNGFAANK